MGMGRFTRPWPKSEADRLRLWNEADAFVSSDAAREYILDTGHSVIVAHSARIVRRVYCAVFSNWQWRQVEHLIARAAVRPFEAKTRRLLERRLDRAHSEVLDTQQAIDRWDEDHAAEAAGKEQA